MHKKIASACRHNDKAVCVHIEYIVKKFSDLFSGARKAKYHIEFTLSVCHAWLLLAPHCPIRSDKCMFLVTQLCLDKIFVVSFCHLLHK